MSGITLALGDLPDSVVAEILALLESVYLTSGDAELGVLLFRLEGVTAMGEITVKDDETTLTAKVTALDAEGHETSFDETPTWESSDDSVATCSPDEDGYSCAFTIGAPGSAVITVTGIESSSGERVEIKSVGTITVTSGDAVVGSVEFETGTP